MNDDRELIGKLQEMLREHTDARDFHQRTIEAITNVLTIFPNLKDNRQPKTLMAAAKPRVTHPDKKSTKISKADAKGDPISDYDVEDVIAIALQLIRKNGGETEAREVHKEVLKQFGKRGLDVASVLLAEVATKDKSRLSVTASGMYVKKSTVKHVEMTRTVEDAADLLEQARINAEVNRHISSI